MKKVTTKISALTASSFAFLLSVPSKVSAQGSVLHIGSLDNLIWSIIKTLQYYSLPIMVLALVFLGVKLVASGSDNSDQQRSIKQTMLWILIGGLLIFSASTIAGIIKGAVEG